MRQFETCELVFQSLEPVGSFVDINLTATISGEQETITLKGFYAGCGIYKVRFLPKYQGRYNYSTSGLVTEKGWVEIEAALPDQHGIVKACEQHFSYEDGTPYYPFGTTVYALSHQTTELIEQTMQTLKQSPFNKLRMCVFPKSYQYNQNEPTYYAFEKDENGQWNVNKPCMEFWDKLETEIIELDRMGIQVDLILFHPYDRWGFAELSQKDNLIYLELDLPSHDDREERDPMITFERIIPYYEGTDYKSPYVSPALGNYEHFPRLCIHVGSEEVLFDDAVLVYNICKEAGVDVSIRIWEEPFHVFPLFPCPESELAISEIACFLKTL